MNKKAIELSVNFIVMLILATVVFGFGLFFVNKVFIQAKEIRAQLDKDTEERIKLTLDRGEKIAFPISNKDIKSNELAIFGLGVINVNTDTTTFHVDVTCSTYVNSGGIEDQSKCSGKWTLPVDDFTLDKNEKKIIPIAIQPPSSKPLGTYAFTVTVTDITSTPSKIYGGVPKQVYVNII